MSRSATDAIAWARARVTSPGQSWERLCLSFVRQAFGVDYTPAIAWPTSDRSAGTAWDRAEHKHRTSDASSIPAGVPVFWETPGAADHVALSTGRGRCLSNDIRRRGGIDEVPIDEITRKWGAQLLGWTEDLVGNRVYTPPKAPAETPNITAFLTAKTHVAKVAALEKIAKHGSAKAKDAAAAWLVADARIRAARRAKAQARATLKGLEVR